MENRNDLTFIHIVIPALIISILLGVAYTSSDEMFTQSLKFSALFLYFPILFFIQGSVCAVLRDNIFLSFGISLAVLVINFFIWTNHGYGAIIFSFIYLVLGLIGYGLTLFIKQMIKDHRIKKSSPFILPEQTKMLHELSKDQDEQSGKSNNRG